MRAWRAPVTAEDTIPVRYVNAIIATQVPPELRAAPVAVIEDGAGEKPVQRRRKVHGDTASKLPWKARKRCEGWNGSFYRRPRDGAAAPVEAKDGPFIEDLLDDLGRG